MVAVVHAHWGPIPRDTLPTVCRRGTALTSNVVVAGWYDVGARHGVVAVTGLGPERPTLKSLLHSPALVDKEA